MTAEISDRVREIAEARGLPESEVIKRALERGLEDLWEDLVLAQYLDGEFDREEAIEKVGRTKVERVEREREAVEADVEWVDERVTNNEQKHSPSERENSPADWGLSLGEAGYEALVEWIERHQQVDPTDPAFTVLDELDDELGPSAVTTDAREEADLVEEWHGSEESFTLADDPLNES